MQTFYYDGICIQNKRKTNMDSLLVKERAVSGVPVCLAAVCDGVGSLKAGGTASFIAIKMLIDWMNHIETVDRAGLSLLNAVHEINRHIVQESGRNGIQTASTISALLLARGRYCIVHAGDSRIYRYSAETLQQLTVDQVRDGKLSDYLGKPGKIQVLYDEGNYLEDKFLLCSDGLYKKLNAKRLEMYCSQANKKNLNGVLNQVVQEAVNSGESDNISAALVLCEGKREKA